MNKCNKRYYYDSSIYIEIVVQLVSLEPEEIQADTITSLKNVTGPAMAGSCSYS